jgi:hypothetical protein
MTKKHALQYFICNPIYSSTEPRPIKVANTAPDEIAIATAKAGKVTVVVAMMSIFSEKRCKLQNANQGNEKPSCQKAESSNFPEENSRGLRNLSQKTRKGLRPKKLASKSKKLELNHTNLKLKSKKTRSRLHQNARSKHYLWTKRQK